MKFKVDVYEAVSHVQVEVECDVADDDLILTAAILKVRNIKPTEYDVRRRIAVRSK